jgi:hypothetical protein
MGQRMDGREPLIACRHAAPAGVLQPLQELPHVLSSDMIHVELIYFLVGFAGNERDEQSQGIAVTVLRIPRQIALTYQMLEEKPPHPRTGSGGISHGAPPGKHTVQSASRRPAATPES